MIQTTPQSLFFTQIRWTQKGPLGFPNIQKHLVTWRDSRLFPPCFGVVLPGRGWIGKSDKRGIVVFFQHHNWKYLRIWDIWDDIVISICLFIWFARILERCLRFLGMAQWWKDKKFKQYMKGPCFGTHSPPTRRIGPGRKPCENFDPFRKRAPALFVFGSVDWARNRSSWTAGNQPISVNCGNFWGGFGKVSEVFGFGALWSLWGKGTTYYLSRVLCFCCEIQSVFFVNVKEPKEMRILQKWLLTLIFVLHICSKDKSGN